MNTVKQTLVALIIHVSIAPLLFGGVDTDSVLLSKHNSKNISESVYHYSRLFLGLPYGTLNYPTLTEASDFKAISSFLLKDELTNSLRYFDCVTYVETILALALANQLGGDFKDNFLLQLKKVRYKDGRASFIHRNHFWSKDWTQNNRWLLEDFTAFITKDHQLATATIQTSQWLIKNRNINSAIETNNTATNSADQLTQALKEEGIVIRDVVVTTPYLTLDYVLNHKKELLASLPAVSIMGIVRPNWNLKAAIGTNLNISHVGFLLNDGKTLLFRNASTLTKNVSDIELTQYLRLYKNSPSIKGINLLKFKGN